MDQNRLTHGIGCRIEVSPPKQNGEELAPRLERFARKFRQTVEAGYAACITDNAMGNLAFQGHELIQDLGLPVRPGQVMLHLNTFHSLHDLHWTLDTARSLGIRELLVISGDGSTRLPRLLPSDLGCRTEVVTSVELIEYIHRHYERDFLIGAAFNQYEPAEHEWEKLVRKVSVGADFFVTQPVVGEHPQIDRLLRSVRQPVILEAWMSPKLNLLSECIGYPLGDEAAFDPLQALQALHSRYPDSGLYLALLDYKQHFPLLRGLGI